MNTNQKEFIMQINRKAGFVLGLLAVVGLGGAAFAAKQHHDREGGWGKGGMIPIAMLLERYDANKDAKLTQDEINGGRTAALTSADADKNSSLALEEFKALWLADNNQRLVRDFQRLDTDGNSQVSAAEFTKPFAARVANADSNGDGVLTTADREYGHRRGHGDHGGNGPDDQDERPE
jgi:hypothetical protein